THSPTHPPTKASNFPMTATFAGLGLHADLVAALARQGITEPFPIQELTISDALAGDRKSTRLNSSHVATSYAGFCLNKKRARNSAGSRTCTATDAPRAVMAIRTIDELAPMTTKSNRRCEISGLAHRNLIPTVSLIVR